MAFPSVAVHLFPLISVFGLYAVSSFFANSGLAVAFAESQAQNGPARLLPDGQTPVLTSYTGLAPLDAYLANLQYIFVPVVDGSSLELSLLGWHWGNLLLALFTVMLGGSLRSGRRRDLVFFALWGLAIQYCGYFVTMPVYCYVHLLSSSKGTPNTTTVRNVSATAARVIPMSVLVGYVLPSVAMSLSSLHSGQSRQVAVAVWQNFPLWVAIFQWALTPSPSPEPAPSKSTSAPGKALPVNSFARIYRAVALVSGLLHVSGLVPVVLATLYPEQLVKLSPMSLDEETLQALQAGNFFLPPKWDNPVPISSMAEGAGIFLRYDYYIGTAAALLWAGMLQTARGLDGLSGWLAGKGVMQILMIVITTVALGPGFTIAILMS
ncbi:Citreoviridin biosynthesis protein [Apiospora marii]|uniref:Citreoviridin biosynthesis protein n=1 Tax=Apiospora marii TaxID=335849 RepID=UPI003130A683